MWKILPWSKDSTGRQRHFDGWRCIENHAETGKTRERFSRHLPRSGPRRLGRSRTGPSGSAWSLSAQTMSNEELEAALKEIIAEVSAAGPQDMGKVMGVATKSWQAKPKDVPSRLKWKNYWDNTPAIHIQETKLLPRFIFTDRSFVFYKISEKQTYAVPYPASQANKRLVYHLNFFRLSFSLHQCPGIQSILQCIQPQ